MNNQGKDHPQGNIVWLASYPKSGNTWFRAFLANLMQGGDIPADINELDGGPIASSRPLFDEATGLSSADLTPSEIEELRPEVYTYLSNEATQILFHKIHDAYTFTSSGKPLVPTEATRCVLYFLRNPLDVAVSFSHHANQPCSTMVDYMNDDNYAFCGKPGKLHHQLTQKLLSWSHHIKSWVDDSGLPVWVIRYEDMKNNPLETFSRAIEFAGLSYETDSIEKAIRFSNFENLSKQEKKKGFKEKAPGSERFFRKGVVGSWREELSPELAEKIIQQHRSMMIRFGYLSGLGKLLV